MRFRPTITDPLEKVCDLADTAMAVIFINRDDCLSPQASGCVDKVLEAVEQVEGPEADQIKDIFTMIQKHGDKIWDDESRVKQMCKCCVMVRDIHYKDWNNEAWMEARQSWVEAL